MPYDKDIESRIQKMVSGWHHTDHKKIFGGICHLIKGNMFCGVYKEFLILRLGEEKAKEAIQSRRVKPFDITGKPMKGWVMIASDGYKSDSDLKTWLDQAKVFAKSLPAK
jgi:TfoX/Sxy family transcriptional regulator of competence genes